MEDFVYILEVYECLGEDTTSTKDYSQVFKTLDECKKYCDNENKKPDNEYHLEPLKITKQDYEEYIKYEDELYNKVC